MISTPKRRTNVTVELSAEVLQFMMLAAPNCSWTPPVPPDKQEQHDRPELAVPNCKWWRVNGKDYIMCKYCLLYTSPSPRD